jgi:ribose/xylose/arabinose/galactoside ABC-type transport system permease subunit
MPAPQTAAPPGYPAPAGYPGFPPGFASQPGFAGQAGPPGQPQDQARRPRRLLLPHLIWEPVLLVLVVLVALGAAAATEGLVFEGESLWWTGAFYGLLASGLALSLRTATPNLAITGFALMAMVVHVTLVTEAEVPPLLAALAAIVVVVTIGLLFGLVTGLTSVPAWAVSLAGLALLQGLALQLIQPIGTGPVESLPAPLTNPYLWLGGFVLISLLGAILHAVPSLRRVFSASRATADPVRFRAARLPGALVGFGGSSALAGLAGLALVTQVGGLTTGLVSLLPLVVVLAAVLIGGISAFGGRGGIAGTVLGVALVAIVIRYLDIERLQFGSEFGQSSTWLVASVLVVLGVLVSRLVEAIAPMPPAQPGPPAAPTPMYAPGAPPPVTAAMPAAAPVASAPPASSGPPVSGGPAVSPASPAPVDPPVSPAPPEPPAAEPPAAEPPAAEPPAAEPAVSSVPPAPAATSTPPVSFAPPAQPESPESGPTVPAAAAPAPGGEPLPTSSEPEPSDGGEQRDR